MTFDKSAILILVPVALAQTEVQAWRACRALLDRAGYDRTICCGLRGEVWMFEVSEESNGDRSN